MLSLIRLSMSDPPEPYPFGRPSSHSVTFTKVGGGCAVSPLLAALTTQKHKQAMGTTVYNPQVTAK